MQTQVERYRDGGTTVYTNEKKSFVLSTSMCKHPNQFYWGTSPYVPDEVITSEAELLEIISLLDESETSCKFGKLCIQDAKTRAVELLEQL